MKILDSVLIVLVLLVQYQLWFGEGSLLEIWQLKQSRDAQELENEDLRERNAALEAEVLDLKQGFEAIEERARTEMGVRSGDSYYRPEPLSKACYALYDAAYDDPNFASSYDQTQVSSVFLFTEFMRFLDGAKAVNELAGVAAESIRNGRRLFGRVGCALCHTPSLRTGDQSNIPALNDRDVPLYSDLLLHHMGPKLADGIVQGRAESNEFRTAPLWGAGQRVFFLHDGRTADLLVAIQEHASDDGGFHSEASGVIDRFRRLSPAEQQDVVNFLRSL